MVELGLFLDVSSNLFSNNDEGDMFVRILIYTHMCLLRNLPPRSADRKRETEKHEQQK